MKNKNGFTLIEIIICITLIVLIGTISIISVSKKNNTNDKEFKNINSAAQVYLDSNEYYKKVLEQEKVVYIKYDELVEKGLIKFVDKSLYNGKCLKLSVDEDNNFISIDPEANISECNKIIVLKDNAKLTTNYNLELTPNKKCYKNEKIYLNINADLNGNEFNSLAIEYKNNGTVLTENIDRDDITINNNLIEYNSFEIEDTFKDITVILNTSYDVPATITLDNPTIYIKDKYKENILEIVDNKVTKINNTNQIDSIKSNNNLISLSTINGDIKNVNSIYVKDECGYEYNYDLIKENVYNYNSYVKFRDVDYNYTDTDYKYYYRFKDGSILYNYYESTCSDDEYWCYNNALKIYNPLTKEEFILYDGYNESNDEIEHNIKVNKIDETKYLINVETDYSQPKHGYAYKYYEEYEYDISKTTQEEAIKVNYRVYKKVGGSEASTPKKNYCKYNYQFYFPIPYYETTEKKYEDDRTVSFSSSKEDFCIGRTNKIESFDSKNERFMSYKNDFISATNNTLTDDYTKTIDSNNTKLLNAFSNSKSKTGQQVSGTYNSSDLHSFIRNKMWENEEYVILPFACRTSSRNEDYSECFLELKKEYNHTLIKII